jgi:nucleotide-binding universal stress UspA family protein
MYKHLLIATDGSELAEKGVRQGLELAKALGADVTIATATEPWDAVLVGEVAVILPPEEYERTASSNAAKILSSAQEIAAELGVLCHALHIKDRRPAEGIIEATREKGCDLIVMTSHGRRGISRLVLGSQSNDVVTHSSVPVLVVR